MTAEAGTEQESSKVVGVAQARGEKLAQEDFTAVGSLDLSTRELRKNLRDTNNVEALAWRPHRPGEREPQTQQVTFLGVYDGHGGDHSSRMLADKLHLIMEDCSPLGCSELVEWYRTLGGFFKRFKGGSLGRIAQEGDTEEQLWRFGFGLDQRATLAFLEADRQLIMSDKTENALMHGLDFPPAPFFGSSLLALTIAHVGDTRAVLCSVEGQPERLTAIHHPDSIRETQRLQKQATGLVTDSFGEVRLGGVLANSRAFGDLNFKRLGVFAEPSITKKVIQGPAYSCLILLSDGVAGAMTDTEICDILRQHSTPSQAAQAIVNFAEDIGTEDNMTAMIAPLPGWGKMVGEDKTADRRAYRMKLADETRRSKRG